MRVLVIHQPVPPQATEDDQDVLVQASAVAEALNRLGHTVVIQPAGKSPAELAYLLHYERPDVVFNLAENFFCKDFFQWVVAGILSELRIPFTGCDEDALFLTGDKLIAKSILNEAGLPTPEWLAPHEVACDWLEQWENRCGKEEAPDKDSSPQMMLFTKVFCRLRLHHAAKWRDVAKQGGFQSDLDSPWDFLCKSAWSHASAGILEQLCRITSLDEQCQLLQDLARRSRRSGEPWFAERFIDGREFNLSLIAGENGPLVLPPAEIDFSAFPPERLRIVGYSAKWVPDSFEYSATPRRFVFPEDDKPLLHQLKIMAKKCWQIFHLRGYARVDFRVDRDGQPWILEINTNPCLSPNAGFAAAAAQAGWSFDQVVAAILADALRRADSVQS
ncbi:MAG: D-alanine--D-alanine ligase family protein [Thermogutta sp.]